MKIRRLRIRLSNAWLKLTFTIASLLLSTATHAQEKNDSIRSVVPKPEPIVLQNDSIRPDGIEDRKLDITSIDQLLVGRRVAYGPPTIFFENKREPLPGSTTIDETLQGTSGDPIYFNKRR